MDLEGVYFAYFWKSIIVIIISNYSYIMMLEFKAQHQAHVHTKHPS